MDNKFRSITINGKKYGWVVKGNCDGDGSNNLSIWDNKKIIHQELVSGHIPITPKLVSVVINKIIEPPMYTHDCDECVFLGRFEKYDLYFCDKSVFQTVIARHGNIGHEYSSGMIFAHKDINPELYEAKQLAIALGLYSDNV